MFSTHKAHMSKMSPDSLVVEVIHQVFIGEAVVSVQGSVREW